MAIAIQPYTEDKISAVQAFNQRLAAGGVAPEFHFPASSLPHWLPKLNGRRIYQEYYLAVDGQSVRGGFILKFQDFALGRDRWPVVYYHLPVSEGIVNKAYASVGVLMLRSALKMQPYLYALGMGGFDRPLPTMLKAMGWSLSEVPFFFRVNHPSIFLREIAALRTNASRRVFAMAAAGTGLGWLGIKALHRFRTRGIPSGLSTETFALFGDWADDLWLENAPRYAMIGDRGSAALNVLYPAGKNFLPIKVMRGLEVLGWAVVLDTQMRDNRYFGNLRVGTIADALAAPENARAVIHSAARFLADRGVDLVIANHSHSGWGKAFGETGFLRAPSNFIFAAANAVADKLSPFETNREQMYFMRGDGDGPVNL